MVLGAAIIWCCGAAVLQCCRKKKKGQGWRLSGWRLKVRGLRYEAKYLITNN
jgi:hypothetical protein